MFWHEISLLKLKLPEDEKLALRHAAGSPLQACLETLRVASPAPGCIAGAGRWEERMVFCIHHLLEIHGHSLLIGTRWTIKSRNVFGSGPYSHELFEHIGTRWTKGIKHWGTSNSCFHHLSRNTWHDIESGLMLDLFSAGSRLELTHASHSQRYHLDAKT